MSRSWIWIFSLCLGSVYGLDRGLNGELLVPPEVIEGQIKDAQQEFDDARKMFNPWYTGPVLAPSAHVLQPPHVNIQPYIFVSGTYGTYDENGHLVNIPDIVGVNPSLSPLQWGITKWMDMAVSLQAIYTEQSGKGYINFGDLSWTLGFGLLQESAYQPAIKFAVKETFPTGQYQNFRPSKAGVQSTGAGSFATTFSLNMSKVIWWLTLHPMSTRLSLNYTVPANVHVEGYNTYGGDSTTVGTVKGGENFLLDWGYEYSFTQRWVAALDFVYTCSWKTTFSGTTIKPVGGPFNDQISLAPAIEYNINDYYGWIGGVWFTVWGRNSGSFVKGVLSFTYTF